MSSFNRLTRVTTPDLPVQVSDVKRHLRLPESVDNTYLEDLIEAATAFIDGPHGVGVSLSLTTYTLNIDDLSSSFTIPIYPVRAVNEIAYLDRTGVGQIVTTGIRFDNSNPARVYHDIRSSALDGSVVVTFTAGFVTIPGDLKQAILMLVGHFYENREATSDEKVETVPLGVETILNRYRVG